MENTIILKKSAIYTVNEVMTAISKSDLRDEQKKTIADDIMLLVETYNMGDGMVDYNILHQAASDNGLVISIREAKEYSKKDIAHVLSNNNIYGHKYKESDVPDALIAPFNTQMNSLVDQYPDLDPMSSDDYLGEADDKFYDALVTLTTPHGISLFDQSKLPGGKMHNESIKEGWEDHVSDEMLSAAKELLKYGAGGSSAKQICDKLLLCKDSQGKYFSTDCSFNDARAAVEKAAAELNVNFQYNSWTDTHDKGWESHKAKYVNETSVPENKNYWADSKSIPESTWTPGTNLVVRNTVTGNIERGVVARDRKLPFYSKRLDSYLLQIGENKTPVYVSRTRLIKEKLATSGDISIPYEIDVANDMGSYPNSKPEVVAWHVLGTAIEDAHIISTTGKPTPISTDKGQLISGTKYKFMLTGTPADLARFCNMGESEFKAEYLNENNIPKKSISRVKINEDDDDAMKAFKIKMISGLVKDNLKSKPATEDEIIALLNKADGTGSWPNGLVEDEHLSEDDIKKIVSVCMVNESKTRIYEEATYQQLRDLCTKLGLADDVYDKLVDLIEADTQNPASVKAKIVSLVGGHENANTILDFIGGLENANEAQRSEYDGATADDMDTSSKEAFKQSLIKKHGDTDTKPGGSRDGITEYFRKSDGNKVGQYDESGKSTYHAVPHNGDEIGGFQKLKHANTSNEDKDEPSHKDIEILSAIDSASNIGTGVKGQEMLDILLRKGYTRTEIASSLRANGVKLEDYDLNPSMLAEGATDYITNWNFDIKSGTSEADMKQRVEADLAKYPNIVAVCNNDFKDPGSYEGVASISYKLTGSKEDFDSLAKSYGMEPGLLKESKNKSGKKSIMLKESLSDSNTSIQYVWLMKGGTSEQDMKDAFGKTAAGLPFKYTFGQYEDEGAGGDASLGIELTGTEKGLYDFLANHTGEVISEDEFRDIFLNESKDKMPSFIKDKRKKKAIKESDDAQIGKLKTGLLKYIADTAKDDAENADYWNSFTGKVNDCDSIDCIKDLIKDMDADAADEIFGEISDGEVNEDATKYAEGSILHFKDGSVSIVVKKEGMSQFNNEVKPDEILVKDYDVNSKRTSGLASPCSAKFLDDNVTKIDTINEDAGGTGMLHHIQQEISGGMISSHIGDSDYKTIDAVRSKALDILGKEGDQAYSIENVKALLNRAKTELATPANEDSEDTFDVKSKSIYHADSEKDAKKYADYINTPDKDGNKSTREVVPMKHTDDTWHVVDKKDVPEKANEAKKKINEGYSAQDLDDMEAAIKSTFGDIQKTISKDDLMSALQMDFSSDPETTNKVMGDVISDLKGRGWTINESSDDGEMSTIQLAKAYKVKLTQADLEEMGNNTTRTKFKEYFSIPVDADENPDYFYHKDFNPDSLNGLKSIDEDEEAGAAMENKIILISDLKMFKESIANTGVKFGIKSTKTVGDKKVFEMKASGKASEMKKIRGIFEADDTEENFDYTQFDDVRLTAKERQSIMDVSNGTKPYNELTTLHDTCSELKPEHMDYLKKFMNREGSKTKE